MPPDVQDGFRLDVGDAASADEEVTVIAVPSVGSRVILTGEADCGVPVGVSADVIVHAFTPALATNEAAVTPSDAATVWISARTRMRSFMSAM